MGFTSFKDYTVISESNICVRISLQYNLPGAERRFREKLFVLKFLNKLTCVCVKYMGYTRLAYT